MEKTSNLLVNYPCRICCHKKGRVVEKASIVFLWVIILLFFSPSLSAGRRYLLDEPLPLSSDPEDTAISESPPSDITQEKRLSVGVILPLSGDYASFGESVLKGILLAGKVFVPASEMEDDGLSIDIIVKDSQADPIITARAVEELYREGVIGIVGPLLSRTSAAGALEAQRLKIPMISLSQKKGLPKTGDYIFRNSLTPSKQAEALVRYAIMELGLDRFGILYPQNSYGKRLMRSFIKEVKKLDGEVVRSERYRDDQTDFGEEIRRLFQIVEIEDPQRKGRKIFEPVIDFDILFIPDYFDRAGLIAPQLAFYNIKDLQLFGSNGWNSPDLLEIGGEFIEGAIFIDGFFLDSSIPVIEKFRKDFEAAFHSIPGILEAQAFDVTNMFMYLLKEKRGTDKESLKESLYNIKDFSGVTGGITFDREGEAVKDLFLLKVEDGKIIHIEELYYYDYEEEEEE